MGSRDRRQIRALVSLLAALQGNGCSWLFVTPPPEAAIAHRVDSCTTSKVAPVLDSLGAGYQVVRTMVAAAAPQRVYDDPNVPLSREADVSFGVALTTMFIASAYYGFSNTAQCRKRDEAGPEWITDEQPEQDSVPRMHRVGEGYRDPRTERRTAAPTSSPSADDQPTTTAGTDAARAAVPAAAIPAPPASVPPAAPAPAPTSTMPAEVIPVPATPAPSAPAVVTPEPTSPAQ